MREQTVLSTSYDDIVSVYNQAIGLLRTVQGPKPNFKRYAELHADLEHRGRIFDGLANLNVQMSNAQVYKLTLASLEIFQQEAMFHKDACKANVQLQLELSPNTETNLMRYLRKETSRVYQIVFACTDMIDKNITEHEKIGVYLMNKMRYLLDSIALAGEFLARTADMLSDVADTYLSAHFASLSMQRMAFSVFNRSEKQQAVDKSDASSRCLNYGTQWSELKCSFCLTEREFLEGIYSNSERPFIPDNWSLEFLHMLAKLPRRNRKAAIIMAMNVIHGVSSVVHRCTSFECVSAIQGSCELLPTGYPELDKYLDMHLISLFAGSSGQWRSTLYGPLTAQFMARKIEERGQACDAMLLLDSDTESQYKYNRNPYNFLAQFLTTKLSELSPVFFSIQLTLRNMMSPSAYLELLIQICSVDRLVSLYLIDVFRRNHAHLLLSLMSFFF